MTQEKLSKTRIKKLLKQYGLLRGGKEDGVYQKYDVTDWTNGRALGLVKELEALADQIRRETLEGFASAMYERPIHETQQKILELVKELGINEFNKLGYRAIGRRIGVSHPQQVKHHMQQLGMKSEARLKSVSSTKEEWQCPDCGETHNDSGHPPYCQFCVGQVTGVI